LAHAESDHAFAQSLARQLEFGCNVQCAADEGLIAAGWDLIDKAEEGLGSDVLVLLLSSASCPAPWPRERWEPVLDAQAGESGVVSVLLDDCSFPALLRRRNFIDARDSRINGVRLLKRWIWQWRQRATHSLNRTFSGDLEDVYSAVADQAGTLRVSGDEASRFVKEAGQEFEAVLWIPCHERSLAQAAGDLGSQLGLNLEDPAEENCRRIHAFLASRRCLLVLDGPSLDLAAELVMRGRTSTLITQEPVKVVETSTSLAQSRRLIEARRYAEAYEMLYALLDDDVSPADCARELSWICDHWNRADESESLRFHYRLPPLEQLSLF
jgi:hypothetical protein